MSTKKYLSEILEQLKWKIWIAQSSWFMKKTNYLVDPMTSKVAIYRDSLTTTILKWKERYALLETNLVK